jgi:probable rRNA maturation factor
MPGQRILFFTDGIQFSLRNRTQVRAWLDTVAKRHAKKIEQLNYIFVSDKRLLQINKDFLQHDTLTDIITFPGEAAKGVISGEIYISIDRVRDNARQYQQSATTELHRVMAHGLLHLCGFKDKSSKDQLTMRSQEEKALDLRTF